MDKIGDHAVVIGASVGGLLAARVSSDAYERVTIVERDVLPTGNENRRGVLQGRHVHALLSSGATILDELFPGLVADIARGGPSVMDRYSQLHGAFGGYRTFHDPAPFPAPVY